MLIMLNPCVYNKMASQPTTTPSSVSKKRRTNGMEVNHNPTSHQSVMSTDICSKTTSTGFKINFKWEIEHFSSYCYCDGNEYPSIISPNFSPSGNSRFQFYLQLYPTGNKLDNSGHLSLFLYQTSSGVDSDPTERVQFKLALVKSDGEKYFQRNGIAKMRNPYSGWGWDKFIGLFYLNTQTSLLLPGDKLTIDCQITIYSKQFNITNQVKDGLVEAIVAAESQLSHDFEQLFTGANSIAQNDVVLRVGGREFSAHKNILMARSRVFSVMFQHDLLERQQNQVNIIDVDVDVFEQLLRFIYTGKVDVDKISVDLLAAADKYQLDFLKSVCEQKLCLSLSIETVSEMLLLADMHQADQLKVRCIDFVNRNSTQVIITEGWKELIKRSPGLVIQLYQDFAVKSANYYETE